MFMIRFSFFLLLSANSFSSTLQVESNKEGEGEGGGDHFLKFLFVAFIFQP